MDGGSFPAIKYANKRFEFPLILPYQSCTYWNRYAIPFGWFANPLPSTASTSWAVFADADFNPLYLGGDWKVYDVLR